MPVDANADDKLTSSWILAADAGARVVSRSLQADQSDQTFKENETPSLIGGLQIDTSQISRR